MKAKLTILLFTILSPIITNSQTSDDLFKIPGAKVTWLGIDYSHVKIIGNISATQNLKLTIDEIKETYFLAWNRLILEESRKYDIRNIFRSRSVQNNIDSINQINTAAAAEDFSDTESPNYKISKIEEFLESYDFGLEGIGLLLIAESLDQSKGIGTYHFVAINLKDKNKILIHDIISGKAGGEGFRNYWARTYYNVIIEITEKRYLIWRKAPESRIKKD
jgi:hypothetical protein